MCCVCYKLFDILELDADYNIGQLGRRMSTGPEIFFYQDFVSS